MHSVDTLTSLVSLILNLLLDAIRFVLLSTRSSAALKAENLFLRKQLALPRTPGQATTT